MTPAEQACRGEIEVTCRILEEHFEMLYGKCVTADQKTQLCNMYSAVRYAYWKLDERESALDGDLAKRTYDDLKVINVRITRMLKNVDDTAVFLTLTAEAVRLAEIPAAAEAARRAH